MACQGCGGTSDKKLCCPTCVEFGRKSFFCNQDCFTKNWKSHAQLHDLLRKQKDLEQQSADAETTGDDGPASPVGDAESTVLAPASAPGVPVQRPAPAPPPSRPQEPAASQRAFAPLAGGVSHLAGLPKRPPPGAGGATAGRAKRSPRPDNANGTSPGADVVGNIVGRFQSMFAGPDGGKAVPEGQKVTRRGSSRERRGEPPVVGPGARARGRSSSRDARDPTKPAASAASKGRFTAQTGLIALIMVIAVAGCTYFYVFQQADTLNFDMQPDTVVIVDETAASAAQEAELPRGGINLQNPEDDVAHVGTVHELQAEISRLRDKVERHDKMLRYVMERYVEKGSLNIGNVEPEKQEDKSEPVQNFYVDKASAPQLFVPHLENTNSSREGLPSGDTELPNKQRRDHRRKGGLDAEPVGEFTDAEPVGEFTDTSDQDIPSDDVAWGSGAGFFSAPESEAESEAGSGAEGGSSETADMRGKRGSQGQGLMQT